ncbi:hypothetical protein FisN_6Hu036 [Fistulifera solaris]|uniref:DNA2/NAM7 helicase helicase domain-containing protein n=1 Tax=Fistulifera solaris TaxID=1519565 RepID=A0A1Z5KI59_FISSO|nr:hypothetical protein FisN_6Hu036 [Fistulifera solaris]|eukprot:GAX25926.1 hypothetical protein FisN_6Hu036 [Fistulifera solaris]
MMPCDSSFKRHQCSLSSWSSADIVRYTSLDPSQADALKHAFTSRVSLIQGPPGTGKTFIGGLIARMIRANTDQSILCICYTNHALDQFLEHMLEAGERRIVRLGCRSKSEKLSGYSLRELVRTKAFESDSRFIKRIDAQLYSMIEDIEEIIRVLKAGVSWFYPDGGIRVLLQEEYPDYYDCFPDFSQDADGFTTTGQDGKSFRKDELWKKWIKGDSFPSFLRNKLDASCPAEFEDIWDLPHGVRLQLKTAWETRVLAGSINEL